jgi:toxin FitB
MAFLLDTNVLSELRKGLRCEAKVRQWAQPTVSARHCISVLSLGEIRKGIELLRRKSPAQCTAFERWLSRLQNDYDRDILPVTEEIACRWGRLMVNRTLPVIDGLLAATALEHNLTIATRNAADFQSTGVTLINPFV